jgi:hypothetical protein
VIDWVHELLLDWGKYQRRQPTGWPTRSVVGRIIEEGPTGASDSRPGTNTPRGVGIPAKLVDICAAISYLPYEQRAALTVRYCTASKRERAWALVESGIKRRELFRLIDRACHQISMYFILKT